jgi:predicted Zn-dependent peptidase
MRLGITYEEVKLPNGLRVVLSRDNAIPVFSLCLIYDVGSRSEEKGHTGYAHLFEHMMAESPAAVDEGEYAKYIERNGGQLSGSAHPGYSIYSVVAPSNQLAPVLWLESGRMRSLSITPETLKARREAIVAERHRMYEEQGYNAAILEGWPGVVFGNFQNAHSIMGSPDDLNAATPDDVTKFFRTYYAPNNAVLAIAGDFQTAEVKKMVEQYFGAIPSQPPPPRPELTEAPRAEGKVRVALDAHIGAPGVIVGWPAPARHSPEWSAMQILDAVLTDGQTARFKLDLVDGRKSLLQYQSNIGWPFESAASSGGPSEYAISVFYRPGLRKELIVNEIQQEIDSVAIRGVDERELHRVKAALRLNKVARLQSSLERATLLAQYELVDSDLTFIEKDFAGLLNVTGVQVQSAARRLLTATRRDVLLIDPPPRPAPAPRPPAGKK